MAVKHLTKREARDLFRAAKLNEQQLYPAAERHYREHGTYPGEYLKAKADTSHAFGVYVDARIFSGITIPADTDNASGKDKQ
jgi:hypothetical protein